MSTIARVPQYLVKLKEREEIAERTMAFRFEKPPGFSFKPGQYLEVTLPEPAATDAEGNARAFSIASAPHENMLMVATRLRESAFKHSLTTMPLNRQVQIEGPFGNFTLHNNTTKAAVLMAGGIGITPFRSIVLRASREKSGHRIFLFYSNRRPEDSPFLEEMQSIEDANPHFKFIGVMTEIEQSRIPWSGEKGRMTQDLIARHLQGIGPAIFYIAGPPSLVSGLQVQLHEMGVDEDDIRAEEFAGY